MVWEYLKNNKLAKGILKTAGGTSSIYAAIYNLENFKYAPEVNNAIVESVQTLPTDMQAVNKATYMMQFPVPFEFLVIGVSGLLGILSLVLYASGAVDFKKYLKLRKTQ